MKTFKEYIVNEWKFNKDTECILLKPETIEQLRMIIMSQLKMNNKRPNMGVVDICNLKNLNDAFSTWESNDDIIDLYGVDMEKIEYIDLSMWDISRINSTHAMFYGLVNLKEVDLTGWDMSKVTNVSAMFSGCKNLETIKGIETWDVSNVLYINNMFKGCEHLELPSWYDRDKYE